MQGSITTIPNTPRINLGWFVPVFSSVCSVGKRPFWGTIKIEYKPQDQLLEFVSVEEWIATLALQSVTIEDVARLAFDEVTRALGDIPLRITVSARTTVHAPAGAIIERGSW